jgi:enoyl-CoA hydratase/carnithine racemase
MLRQRKALRQSLAKPHTDARQLESWGDPANPQKAARKGLLHEIVDGKALGRAMEIAAVIPVPESVAQIDRVVGNATETPLPMDWRSVEICS